MKIAYYLNEGRKKNLYCRINEGTERVTFSLEHTIDPRQWDAKNEEVPFDDPYYFTLIRFKQYLEKRFYVLKTEEKTQILTILKNEAASILGDSGIKGIARKMFDDENEKYEIPKYDLFLEAFEKFSGLSKKDYQAETIDYEIHFHTKDEVYEMNTYEGKTALLRAFVERKSYEEIYTMTDEGIWNEIYKDLEIEKHELLPKMFRQWEIYWASEFQNIKDKVGKTDHMDKPKQESWRQFQVFMECYENSTDLIILASEIGESTLFPCAIIAMLKLSDADSCYHEYCEMEFNDESWKDISLGDDDDFESPVFYIRPYDV